MPSKILSVELHGLEGFLVEIEVDRRAGVPKFFMVGLPDTAVLEARERVKSAIRNSDFEFPRSKVIVNLAPADLKKVGPRYDLAIALGILAMQGYISASELSNTIVIGELALDGAVRPIHGILASVEYAKKQGFKKIILPKDNAREAALIDDIKIIGVSNLKEAVMHLKGKLSAIVILPPVQIRKPCKGVNMSQIKGQALAKRALEIAAAGGHNILFNGAPGAGKTMMAKAFSGILPSMTMEEMLETSKIYSIAGLLPKNQPLINERPFRTIHHTASAVSIVGGGNIPGPGEISLAHRGVLFMDEIAEFPKQVLEVLRQPMEDRFITVSRVRGTFIYPCHFSLIASMNPCPCGYYNVEHSKKICTCRAVEILRYQKKLSGPLMDRIDMHISISAVEHSKLKTLKPDESSSEIRKRVEQAANIQRTRFKNETIIQNSEMQNNHIEKYCNLDNESETLLGKAVSQLDLTARGYFRIIKLARTIADLNKQLDIKANHIAEALQYRGQIFRN